MSIENSKQCSKCKATKPRTDFFKKSGRKDGLSSNCKQCHKLMIQNRTSPKPERKYVNEKQCRTCGETKNSSDFFREAGCSDGLRGSCKTCVTAAKNERLANRTELPTVHEKACTTCLKVKRAEVFCRNALTKDGLSYKCRRCQRAYHIALKAGWSEERKAKEAIKAREYAAANPEVRRRAHARYCQTEKGKEQRRTMRERNRNSALAYGKRWRENNLERHRAAVANWRANNLHVIKAYREANAGLIRAKDRIRKALRLKENPEAASESYKAWREKNPERFRAAKNRNHAMRRAAVRYACVGWANEKAMAVFYAEAVRLGVMTGKKHHVDHIVPLISEFVCGLHWEENLSVLGKIANLKKKNYWWPGMSDTTDPDLLQMVADFKAPQ